MTEFKVGDRVRIKDRPDWPSPPGYRLANAEATVTKWCEWDEVFEEFQDYVSVQLEKTEVEVNIDNIMFFRVENLEKV